MVIEKWDERVQWSYRRLMYHVFAMHVMCGELKEECLEQMEKWREECVDVKIRDVCSQLTSDAFTQVQMILAMENGDKSKVNYKIDMGYPVQFDNLPNNLRINDLLDMRKFFEVPCVKEVSNYVKEINLRASREVR